MLGQTVQERTPSPVVEVPSVYEGAYFFSVFSFLDLGLYGFQLVFVVVNKWELDEAIAEEVFDRKKELEDVTGTEPEQGWGHFSWLLQRGAKQVVQMVRSYGCMYTAKIYVHSCEPWPQRKSKGDLAPVIKRMSRWGIVTVLLSVDSPPLQLFLCI
uniref:Uncharacterized protein n=1 Tax=Eutreptiella gymnastica TaxID=73025 RepID=A0A7S1NS83_9EUGL